MPPDSGRRKHWSWKVDMSKELSVLSKCVRGAYENREMSWLSFNKRVLDQAMDLTNPLLERCKFLSIFISNLDEFIQVRLGTLINQSSRDPLARENKTEMTAKEQVDAILTCLPSLYKASNETWRFLRTELYDKGVSILKSKDLSERQKLVAQEVFEKEILPRTTPMVLDSKHPLYRFENIKVYLLVSLERKGRMMIGVASLHSSTPRLIRLTGGKKTHLMLCEEMLYGFADKVFPGFNIESKALVRVTRNADFDATMEDADDEFGFDFSRLVQTRVEGRTGSDVIRLESTELSETLKGFLLKNLGIKKSHCFQIQGCFDYKFMFRLGDFIDYETVSSLRYSAYKPVIPRALSGCTDLISEVKRHDIFLAYPFQSMDVLLNLLSQAADDPRVTSVKITIYRLADRSKIIEHLLRAAENGKEVVAVMELCARFDEENNLYNADLLRDAGCTVFYGIEDYKVHSKIISITMEDDEGISYITQLGTGNYNESTAKQYTDLNIITANEEIGQDAVAFFRNLAVLNVEYTYKRLLVAPYSLKSGLLAEIDREIEKGSEGLIRIKINSLTDKECIEKLIEASQAGCTVSMIVRGICCLVPGVENQTENISVISIVGRFLEHSRIYAFGRGDDERLYISSADMMTRNLEKRVEIATPVLDPQIKKKVLHILSLAESDNVKARRLNSDGSYSKIQNLSSPINSQEECIKEALTL